MDSAAVAQTIPPRRVPAGPSMAAVVFATAVFIPGHLFGWAVEWMWLAFAAGLGMVACLLSCQKLVAPCNLPASAWIGLHLLLEIVIVAGAVHAVANEGFPLGQRDLVELVRLPVYALFGLLIGTLTMRRDERFTDRILRAMVLLLCLGAVAMILQLPVLYPMLNALYAEAKTQVGMGVYRFSMPFQNPNFLAFVLLPTLAWFLFFRVNVPFALLALAGLGLTGSRSGWIAALPILLCAYVYWLGAAAWKGWTLRAILLMLLPVGLGTAAIANLETLREIQRLAELLDALEGGGITGVQTAAIRLSEGARLFEDYVAVSPFIGWGPGRELGVDVADNQYMSWALMYGLVGACLLALLLGAMFLQSLLTTSSMRHLIGMGALGVSIMMILITGDFLENYRLYFFSVFMLHVMFQACVAGDAKVVTELPAEGR